MASFLQSPSWAAFNKALGTTTYQSSELLYLQRSFSFGSYFLCSRCIIPTTYEIPTFPSTPCFIRYEPEDDNSWKILEEYAQKHSLRLQPTFAVQPRQTVIVSLESDEEVLQSMKQKASL